MLTEFINYLYEQIGQPYLWGGQHTKLTPENYVRVIEKKEAGRGGYPDGESYAQACIDFCRKKFEEGATVLYGYDCSGLGCYWLENLAHLYRCDVNANTMMGRCELKEEPPKRGWWVFRLDGKRAVHIGYMIDNEYLIEAAGRKYGVVKTKFRAHDWDVWGIPKAFEDEIRHPDPQPEPPDPPTPPDPPVPPEPPTPTKQMVYVIGRSVNVRDSDSKSGKILFTAHKGNRFNLIDISPNTGWYRIDTYKGPAYISNREDLTCLITVS